MDARLSDYVRGQWPALVRYGTALAGNTTDGEELVQSALVRVALRWPFVRDKDNPDAYVRRAILHGHVNLRQRLRSRETSVADLPERQTADASDAVDDLVTTRRVLAGLPPRQRAVLVLRYLEDQSEQQTADLLGCSVGTVKSQTSKGLARLRAAIAADGAEALEPNGGSR